MVSYSHSIATIFSRFDTMHERDIQGDTARQQQSRYAASLGCSRAAKRTTVLLTSAGFAPSFPYFSNCRWSLVYINKARWSTLYQRLKQRTTNAECALTLWRATYHYTAIRWLVHWPLIGGLLHSVRRGGAWAGCAPAQAPPRCTKCNSPPINGMYQLHVIRCGTIIASAH